jgi:hypothetical protein
VGYRAPHAHAHRGLTWLPRPHVERSVQRNDDPVTPRP